MDKILSLIPMLIILFAGWKHYQKWSDHQVELQNAKAEIRIQKLNIKKKKKKLKELSRYKEDIERAKENINKVALELEKSQKRFPDKMSDTANLELLKSLASGINMKDVFLSPGKKIDKKFYWIKRYLLNARGTYLQFLVLLEYLAEQDLIFNVHSLEFNNKKLKQKGRFQIIEGKLAVEVYQYNTQYKLKTGIEEIENKYKR